jgi:4-hydroxy-tetrahydrodipicolinate reductase
VTVLGIVGGSGRMGQVLATGLAGLDDFSVAVLVDPFEPPARHGALWVHTIHEIDPDSLDAVIDFSTPEGVVASARWCATHRKVLIVGTTGLTAEQRSELELAGAATGVVLCANYSIGAVLAERFAAQAAPYFDTVEVIELHHDRKVDAPSGTSLQAVRRMAAAREASGRAPITNPTTRETLPGTRGGVGLGGVRIHSVRLPGLTAHQEILFGAPGEGLTIRHDAYDRVSFVHGVALALRHLTVESGFVEGIDEFLD